MTYEAAWPPHRLVDHLEPHAEGEADQGPIGLGLVIERRDEAGDDTRSGSQRYNSRPPTSSTSPRARLSSAPFGRQWPGEGQECPVPGVLIVPIATGFDRGLSHDRGSVRVGKSLAELMEPVHSASADISAKMVTPNPWGLEVRADPGVGLPSHADRVRAGTASRPWSAGLPHTPHKTVEPSVAVDLA